MQAKNTKLHEKQNVASETIKLHSRQYVASKKELQYVASEEH